MPFPSIAAALLSTSPTLRADCSIACDPPLLFVRREFLAMHSSEPMRTNTRAKAIRLRSGPRNRYLRISSMSHMSLLLIANVLVLSGTSGGRSA